MRLIALIEYAAVVIGIVAMIAGHFFAIPKGFHLGVLVIGVGFALGGLEGVFTRRMPFRPSDDAYEAYGGLPSLIIGLMALAIGAAFIGSAYLLDMAQWHATAHYLNRRPAPVLGAGGLFLIGFGVLLMLNPEGRSSWLWRIFVYFPRALLGAIVAAAGFASIGLGVYEWLDPKAFDAFVASLPQRLDQLRRMIGG